MAEESDDENSVRTDADADDVDRRPPPPPPPPPLCVLRAHSGDVQAVALSSCGSLLYSGDSEGLLRIWDVDDRRPVSGEATKLHQPEGGVLGLRVLSSPRFGGVSSSPRPFLLLSQGREGTIKLWRLGDEGGREVVDSSDESSSPSSPPPPRPLATTLTGSKGFCVLSAVEQPEASAEEEGEGEAEEDDDDEEGDDGKHPPPPLFVAVASEDAASVLVFDARRGGPDPLCELSEAEAAAAPSPVAHDSAEASKSRGMAMAVCLFFTSSPSSSSPLELCALVGYEDGSVVLWRCLKEEARGGEPSRRKGKRRKRKTTPAVEALASLRVHFDAVTAVAGPVSFSSTEAEEKEELSLRFFSGGADSALATYEVRVGRGEEEGEGAEGEEGSSEKEEKKRALTLVAGPAAKLPSRGVGALAVSQRGEEETLIAAGGWDGTIRLLALKKEKNEEREINDDVDSTTSFSLEPLGELEHHVAPVASLCFGLSEVEGELLASGGRDGSIALWGGLV